ncbi:hypothetical protein [Geomicrobium sp. JCM 19037]|uniref:hypothetical protein n=1 Tax=Geomicrobium sp. JCM 19037 TaxID=1460634 RepID=UPI0026CC04E2|nr:hypothetical protein [Geomicrobium sp. JCM 19037]
MFLEATKKRNPNLIHSAVDLHQAADIPPNTYVIDMDTVAANTRALAEKAREHDFSLYFMTKQLGRIPKLAQWIANHGIQKAVAVEWNEASRYTRAESPSVTPDISFNQASINGRTF